MYRTTFAVPIEKKSIFITMAEKCGYGSRESGSFAATYQNASGNKYAVMSIALTPAEIIRVNTAYAALDDNDKAGVIWGTSDEETDEFVASNTNASDCRPQQFLSFCGLTEFVAAGD